MVSCAAEPVASSDEGLHEEGGDVGVFAGYGVGGLACEIICQFMLRKPARGALRRRPGRRAGRPIPGGRNGGGGGRRSAAAAAARRGGGGRLRSGCGPQGRRWAGCWRWSSEMVTPAPGVLDAPAGRNNLPHCARRGTAVGRRFLYKRFGRRPISARRIDSGLRRSICVGSQAVFRRPGAGHGPATRGCRGRRWRSAALPASELPPSAPLCPACRAPASPGRTPATPHCAAPPSITPATLCPDRPECCAGPAAARCPGNRVAAVSCPTPGTLW